MLPTVNKLIQQGYVKSVVLGGGRSGRTNALGDPERHAYALSKVLAQVGNKRVIEFSLDAARKLGDIQTRVGVWHLHETIEQVIRRDDVKFVVERLQDPEDTAGPVASIVSQEGWDSTKNNLIIVQSGDIVHNVPLEEVIDAHLRNNAAATVVVTSVPWDQIDRYGTVRLEGMPRREDFESELHFEDAVGAWYTDRKAAETKIVEFREKKPRFHPDPSKACLSNFASASVYVFSAWALRPLITMMTKKGQDEPLFPKLYKAGGPSPFSDWARHVFPWFTHPDQRETFPFYAYVLPQIYPSGVRSYYRDIGYGIDIRLANMDALDGRFDAGLGKLKKTRWGWRGKRVKIHPSSIKLLEKVALLDDTDVRENVRIDSSVIGQSTIIKDGARNYRTVVFPKPYARNEPNIIGAGSRMVECVFLGGEIKDNAVYERKMVYTPAGGCAIDSLLEQTEFK